MKQEKKQSKLDIRQRRVFSEALKKQVVSQLTQNRTTISKVMSEHQVSAQSVYRWLYRYSPHHQPQCTLVVQMQSEEMKTQQLQQRLADLERIVGQKQMQIDYLNKLIELGSRELGIDLKKNYSPPPSSGSVSTPTPVPTP